VTAVQFQWRLEEIGVGTLIGAWPDHPCQPLLPLTWGHASLRSIDHCYVSRPHALSNAGTVTLNALGPSCILTSMHSQVTHFIIVEVAYQWINLTSLTSAVGTCQCSTAQTVHFSCSNIVLLHHSRLDTFELFMGMGKPTTVTWPTSPYHTCKMYTQTCTPSTGTREIWIYPEVGYSARKRVCPGMHVQQIGQLTVNGHSSSHWIWCKIRFSCPTIL
jgi:hypothetical protein